MSVCAAGVLTCFFGCTRWLEPAGPNVVLVTLDTTRADRIGAMGYEHARTPVLDGLAERGVVFERAYASAPLTLPSHLTILSGLDPNRHGIHDNGRFVVPESIETAAERYRARGYRTGAFIGAFVLDSMFGLDQGFETYDDGGQGEATPLSFGFARRPGQETTDAALAWLEANAGRPYFLWVHYFDVHVPRTPPPPFDEMPDRYDGALAYVDQQIGRLLKGVERASRGRETVMVATADHGESLGSHGEATHGIVAYDSTLHVPLIVAGPGFAAGTRVDRFVRTTDVAATLFALAGTAPGSAVDGRPLQTLLGGSTPGEAEPRRQYFESFGPSYNFGWARIAGVRDERWKLTVEPQPIELFDVVQDAAEETNLAARKLEVVAALREAFERLPHVEQAPDLPGDAHEVREKLSALGYVSVPAREVAADAPDPRRYAAGVAWVDAARALATEGRVADAIEALEIFVAESPVARPLALRSIAPLYLLVGREEEAVEAYRKLAESTGASEYGLGLAQVLLRLGKPDEALAEIGRLLGAEGSTSPRGELVRGLALLAQNRLEEAEAVADRLLAADPGFDGAIALASRVRVAREGPNAEIDRLEAAIAAAPAGDLRETRSLLATLLHAVGRDKKAIEILRAGGTTTLEERLVLAEIFESRGMNEEAAAELQEVVRAVPGSVEGMLRLADLRQKLGRPDEAIALYDRLIELRPDDATLYTDRGAVHHKSGNLKRAAADYRAALEKDERLAEAAFNLALVLLAEDREVEATELLLRAAKEKPDYRKAHFQLARIFKKNGDPRAEAHARLASEDSLSTASVAKEGE